MKTQFTNGQWDAFPLDNPKVIKSVFGTPGNDESELMPVTSLGVGKNTLSNAKLIAAAPELLIALRELSDAVTNTECNISDELDYAMNEAERLIKKATE